MKFEPWLLRNHIECLIAAAAGVTVATARRRIREVSFPLVLVLTAAGIHAIHRPWFDYYYLHFAIPLAWLAGWTANEVMQWLARLHARRSFTLRSAASWTALALCVLTALALARSERRLEWTMRDLRSRPRAEENPIVRKMVENADHTRLVYSESGIYPFHSGLPVLPQLAIISSKRFWSGNITTGEIIELCRLEKPELIVLPRTTINAEWKSFLGQHYNLIGTDEKSLLYSSGRIGQQVIRLRLSEDTPEEVGSP
jgi:hypothetical protein